MNSSAHIETTAGVCGGVPRIAGTRIRVQDIYVWHELQGLSPEEIAAAYPHLTLAGIHAALAYYFDHAEEIREQMDAGQAFVAALKAEQCPGPLARKLGQMPNDDAANPLPPG